MKDGTPAKERLDRLLVLRGLCASREEAQRMCLAGMVFSGDRRLEKCGASIPFETPLEIRGRKAPFVSRAGEKLQFALDRWSLSVEGAVCLDVGASTGGFTDCLLQRGAQRVFSIDVGYGQLDSRLRRDERVVVVERTNARFLTQAALAERHPSAAAVEFLCADVSFIGLDKAVLPLRREFPTLRRWVLLFKPQFEVGPEHVGRAGLVSNRAVVSQELDRFIAQAAAVGLQLRGGPETSPLVGKKSGNEELLLLFEADGVMLQAPS